MDSNRELIIAEFEAHKGEFVISWDKVVRLIGIVDSIDDDYYWLFFDGRKLSMSSCVGGFIPLKGKIDEKDYDELIRLAKLNHIDLLENVVKGFDQEKFKYDLINDVYSDGDVFMARPCWDLN